MYVMCKFIHLYNVGSDMCKCFDHHHMSSNSNSINQLKAILFAEHTEHWGRQYTCKFYSTFNKFFTETSACKAVNHGAVPVLLQMFCDWQRTDHHNRQAGVRKAILSVLKSIVMTSEFCGRGEWGQWQQAGRSEEGYPECIEEYCHDKWVLREERVGIVVTTGRQEWGRLSWVYWRVLSWQVSSDSGGEGGIVTTGRQEWERLSWALVLKSKFCHDMTSKFCGRGGWGQWQQAGESEEGYPECTEEYFRDKWVLWEGRVGTVTTGKQEWGRLSWVYWRALSLQVSSEEGEGGDSDNRQAGVRKAILRPRPHYTVFKWKRYCFVPDTATVHTTTLKMITENRSFRKHSPEWNDLKTVLFENAVS